MVMDIQNKVAQLRNEVQSQKVYSGLTYSQLLLPENTPTQSYSGNIDLSRSGEPIARVRFRFTRSDGLTDAPMINFAYSSSISPTYQSFAESYGFVFSANELGYIDTTQVAGYIGEIGDGYVDFYVDFDSYLKSMFFSRNSISISVSCQAIANVFGTLTVDRVI